MSSLLALVPPLMFRALLDSAVPDRDLGQVNRLMLVAVLTAAMSYVLLFLGGYVGTRAGTGIIRDVRQAMFDHMQRLPLQFFLQARTGAVQSRFTNDVTNAQQMFTGPLFSGTVGSLAADVLVLVTTIAAMFVLNPLIMLAALLMVPFLLWMTSRVSRQTRILVGNQMALFSRMYSFTTERFNVSGAMLVRLFGRLGYESGQYRERIGELRRNNIRVNLLGTVIGTGIGAIGFAAMLAVYWTGGALALNGAVSLGTVVALAVYAQRAYTPLLDLSSARMNLEGALVSFERIFEILDIAPSVLTPEHAIEEIGEGELRASGVWFRYPASGVGVPASLVEEGADRPAEANAPWVLEDIDLVVPAGKMTALVGHSGSGKTTLCMLLARLQNPTRGKVDLDGTDIDRYSIEALTRAIGFATQDAHFFHESVRDNLRYARPDATDDQIVEACRQAYIHEAIDAMPDGYDTVVGERGYRLSGGEKQRLALARILLRDPRILLLDEATAHLDSRTEAVVQRALQSVLRGRTSIVIAHRLSTIRRADQIVVVSGGRIVDIGTHDSLLESSATYQELYRYQYSSMPTRS